jgi:hypothetical protein
VRGGASNGGGSFNGGGEEQRWQHDKKSFGREKERVAPL